MLRSLLSSISRTTLPGWLALRVWLMLGLVAPALGLGGWAQPAAADQARVAERGVHAGPSGHADPAEIPHDFPARGQAEDGEDAKDSKDDLRKRASASPLWLSSSVFDLRFLAASVAAHRFVDGHAGGPGSTHRDQLHNRGPPVA